MLITIRVANQETRFLIPDTRSAVSVRARDMIIVIIPASVHVGNASPKIKNNTGGTAMNASEIVLILPNIRLRIPEVSMSNKASPINPLTT